MTRVTGRICAGTVETNGCKIFDAGYNWDKAGNLITQTFSTGSRYAETYSYDGLNRLTQAKLLMQGGVPQSTVTQGFEYGALNLLSLRSQRIDLKLRIALGQHLGECSHRFGHRGPFGCGEFLQRQIDHHDDIRAQIVGQRPQGQGCGACAHSELTRCAPSTATVAPDMAAPASDASSSSGPSRSVISPKRRLGMRLRSLSPASLVRKSRFRSVTT